MPKAVQESGFTPAEVINERPRPRVLVWGFGDKTAKTVLAVVREVAPTADATEYLSTVSLSEYDCVITSKEYVSIKAHTPAPRTVYRSGSEEETTWKWKQLFPPHISIIYLPSNDRHGLDIIDFVPQSGEGDAPPACALILGEPEPGKHIRYVAGLQSHVKAVTRQFAVAAAQARELHRTVHVNDQGDDEGSGSLKFNPFLLGPDDHNLLGSYDRSEEASVWVLPRDLLGGDLRAWVAAALQEWHSRYPARFPEVPDWPSEPQWHNRHEQEVFEAIENVQEEMHAATLAFESRLADLRADAAVASEAADDYERALLSSTGTNLELAVGRALTDIGFEVREMDSHFPADALREDFRVRDPDTDPSWECLVEVKGFSKGVAETGLQSLSRWSEFYIVDTGRLPSARWYIANFRLNQNPSSRGTALSGRDDVIEVFEQSGGLLLDTRAVFRLLVACQWDARLKVSARDLLRTKTGRFGLEEADQWLAERKNADRIAGSG